MLIIYLVLINAVAFALMLADKHKARKNLWRITAALLGGSLGAIAGMYAARHKTKHLRFSVGLPVILALQVITGIILYGQII